MEHNNSQSASFAAAGVDITASRLKEMVFTNSIQPTEDFEASPKLRWISIAPLIGEAISRTASEQSVSSLFI